MCGSWVEGESDSATATEFISISSNSCVRKTDPGSPPTASIGRVQNFMSGNQITPHKQMRVCVYVHLPVCQSVCLTIRVCQSVFRNDTGERFFCVLGPGKHDMCVILAATSKMLTTSDASMSSNTLMQFSYLLKSAIPW